MLFTIQRDRWTHTCNLHRTLPPKNYVHAHTWAWIASETDWTEERKKEQKNTATTKKNQYDFNKWSIWMKLKMFSSSTTAWMTGQTTKKAHSSAEKNHGPVTLLSNLQEMFSVPFKKRFSKNREIGPNWTQSSLVCGRGRSHSNKEWDVRQNDEGNNGGKSIHLSNICTYKNSKRCCNSCHFMLDMLLIFTSRFHVEKEHADEKIIGCISMILRTIFTCFQNFIGFKYLYRSFYNASNLTERWHPMKLG